MRHTNSRHKRIIKHINSGDYFATLSEYLTALEARDQRNLSRHARARYVRINSRHLKTLAQDMEFLQDNFHLVPK